MAGTIISYLACGSGHSVSVGLQAIEVVGVLLPLAGLVSLVIGLTQRFAAAKQPPPPFPGYPAGAPPGPKPRGPGPKPKGTTFIMAGVALVVLGLLCFLFLSLLAC